MSVHPPRGLAPGDLHPAVTYRRILTTPAEVVDFRFPGTGMWGHTLQGLSLYKAMGEWRVGYVPDRDLIEGLEVLYRGGHEYELTEAEDAELSAAGFSDYIRTEEPRP